MNTRQPMSKLEKLAEGLRVIKQYQPAAEVNALDGLILVGDTKDPHVSMGARQFLRGIGFAEDDLHKRFVFSTRSK